MQQQVMSETDKQRVLLENARSGKSLQFITFTVGDKRCGEAFEVHCPSWLLQERAKLLLQEDLLADYMHICNRSVFEPRMNPALSDDFDFRYVSGSVSKT